jgi:hypothetical protein
VVDLGPGKGEEIFIRVAAGVLPNMTEGNRVASLFDATPELVAGDITAPINLLGLSLVFSIAAKRWLRRLVWTDVAFNMFALLRKLDLVETFTALIFDCNTLPTSAVLLLLLKKAPARAISL